MLRTVHIVRHARVVKLVQLSSHWQLRDLQSVPAHTLTVLHKASGTSH